jgi:type IV pilus assembly protein PilM
MFFSSNKSVLGIDIGTTNIKLVQISHDGKKYLLDTYGMVDVAFEIDERKEANIQKTVSVLQMLIAKSGVTTKKVMASLPASVVFTTIIVLPRMKDSELQNAVEFEAKKYVPLPLSEVTLSWTSAPEENPENNRVLITAVPNNILKGYLRIFELAKLQPQALEIESLSLMRALVGSDNSNILMIDIGAKNTHLDIIERGNLVLTRNVPIGGETITNKIASSLNITPARAEQFKKEFGMNQVSIIPEMVKPILLNIRQEVIQVQSIYHARGKTFDKIILVGGGANLPGFAEYLSDLGPQVSKGDPLSQITFNPQLEPLLREYSTSLAVAIGLAMRSTK